jgi:hypothetical protein
MEGAFWIVTIVMYAAVVGWAIEVLRRLGDHTKILTRIADELRELRTSDSA